MRHIQLTMDGRSPYGRLRGETPEQWVRRLQAQRSRAKARRCAEASLALARARQHRDAEGFFQRALELLAAPGDP